MNEAKSPNPLPPHPVLSGHYGSADRRVGYIRHLFDASAASYDRINAWMSLRTGERYRYDALRRAGMTEGQWALDIACGTGVMAMHAQRIVGDRGGVVAIDPSLPMLVEVGGRGVRNRVAGIAEQLPLADASVDFISMGYALRHVQDLRITFAEYLRVLRPGGTLLILEMVPPTSRIGYGLTKLYLKYLVPGITSLVTRSKHARRLMEYYWDTVEQCVSPQVVQNALGEVGFERIERAVLFRLMNEYRARKS